MISLVGSCRVWTGEVVLCYTGLEPGSCEKEIEDLPVCVHATGLLNDAGCRGKRSGL